MTYAEAKQAVEECGLNIEHPLHEKVLNIVVNALEKQIPKRTRLLPIGMNAENGEEIRFVMCNTCKKPFMRDTKIKYCCFCGQALDWSDNDV